MPEEDPADEIAPSSSISVKSWFELSVRSHPTSKFFQIVFIFTVSRLFSRGITLF